MYFWANSRCRIENSAEKSSRISLPLYITGLKIVPRAIVGRKVCCYKKGPGIQHECYMTACLIVS